MSNENLPDLPAQSPLIAPDPPPPGQPEKEASGLMTWDWIQYFQEWASRILESPQRLALKTLPETQAASIATTPIPTGTLPSGAFRLSIYGRVTQAASVSSSLILTLGWTDNGVSCTKSSAAITGNTVTSLDSLSVVVPGDNAAALTYSTTYASAGGTPMHYKLLVLAEGLS